MSLRTLVILLITILFATMSFAQDAVSDSKQRAKDEQLLQEYFTQKNIKPVKTSGLYVLITKEGYGRQILAGEKVTLNYKGYFLDGKVFDSNTDTAFGTPAPYTVEIGTNKVIRGWDKGVTKLKRGSVATLYIPSGMAYGPYGDGGVPPNTVLVFDIEILNVTR